MLLLRFHFLVAEISGELVHPREVLGRFFLGFQNCFFCQV
jgi:hypothetical protein